MSVTLATLARRPVSAMQALMGRARDIVGVPHPFHCETTAYLHRRQMEQDAETLRLRKVWDDAAQVRAAEERRAAADDSAIFLMMIAMLAGGRQTFGYEPGF